MKTMQNFAISAAARRPQMNASRIARSGAGWSLLVLAAALGCASALAADKAVLVEAQARYQQERAVCMNGLSNQDRLTCLREANAALAQAKHEGLDDGAASYTRNARQRCEGLPAEDRQACIARMQGQGTTSGSAASGGIYRELVTREIASPGVAVPSADPQAAPAK